MIAWIDITYQQPLNALVGAIFRRRLGSELELSKAISIYTALIKTALLFSNLSE